MMRNRFFAAALALGCVSTAQAQVVVYSDNFDAGTSASTWTTSVSTGAPAINTANMAFDYSTVGIPAAPNSTGGSTIGAQLRANQPSGATFSGLSIAPNGQSFTGDYTLRFDAWQNFNGGFPGGGSGSTQATGGGIGANTNTAQFIGTAIEGVYFAGTGDGGSGLDYRAYTNTGASLAPSTGVYAAGTQSTAQNNTDAFYSTNMFGSVDAPAAQLLLFPQQTGTTAPGTLGMLWRTWTIEKVGDIVTWSVTNNVGTNVLLATVDTSIAGNELTGDNIFLGHFDINATSSGDVNADSLLFGLFDNVVVTAPVPEPGLLLGALALPAYLLRRRCKS